MSKYGVISVPYFPVFSQNTGKYGPEINLYLDTFHAVEGNFVWWYSFCMTKFYLSILENVADILFGDAVVLVSMYVANDFWRALTWHSAPYPYLDCVPLGGPFKMAVLCLS